MPRGRHRAIPPDSLQRLRQRLEQLPPRSPERSSEVSAFAGLYGVSPASVYRAICRCQQPHAAHRADFGKPRIMDFDKLERFCELIAALKLRTTNKNGRHLSTQRAIELMENYGVETNAGLITAPKGTLCKTTVNRYLAKFHLDQPRMIRQCAAVRFEAEFSNGCWQFDMSPSDLKHIDQPDWIEPPR